jgi:hypothetical protein
MAHRFIILICVYLFSRPGLAQQYKPGYFITADEKKVKGTIKFKLTEYGYMTTSESIPGQIKFRPEGEKKAILLSASEIRGFVAGKDSFAIIRNFRISESRYFKRDFARVAQLGRINLYIHYSQLPSGRFGVSIKQVYVLVKEKEEISCIYNRYQRTEFSKLIADWPELVTQIEKDRDWFEKIPDLVEKYNRHFQ